VRITGAIAAVILALSWWVLNPLARPDEAADAHSLKQAIDSGDVSQVREQVRRGADVNARADGTTPLVRATIGGQLEMVQALLKLGADVDRTTVSGHTALSMAVSLERDDVLPVLLKAGANPSLRNDLGLSAMDAARGRPEVEDMLEQALRDAPSRDAVRRVLAKAEIQVRPSAR
jgi:uncharacterized protein